MRSATTTSDHKHEPYSHHRGQFRCRCGATATSGAGPWSSDGTRGCVVCAAPTTETGDDPLCTWHRSLATKQEVR